MRKFTLAPELSIPIDAVTQRISILGRTGSGKSHTAGVFAEEVIKGNHQTVIVDPKGDWWGLRASADGKSAGLPITIMGGEHGDLPLDPTAGALVADIVINEGISVILDLSLFESKAQEIRFMEAFADRLYRKNRRPLLLIVDEADIFAPQHPEKNETTMLNRMETICRRGRSKGIGVVLITQRSASLHKGCLSQTELMIVHQTTAPQDKKAIEFWVVDHGDDEQREQFMNRIPKLATGQAIVWSPSWLEIYLETKIRQKFTYDSSATPKVGVRRRSPKVLAAVDLERLKTHMSSAIEKMKQEDPKLLREQIATLKAQLAQKPQVDAGTFIKRELEAMKKRPMTLGKPVMITKTVSVQRPVVLKRHLNRMEKALASLEKFQAAVYKSFDASVSAFGKASHELLEAIRSAKDLGKLPPPQDFSESKAAPPITLKAGPSKHDGPKIPLSKIPEGPPPAEGAVLAGERDILMNLFRFRRHLTREQLGVLSGIHHKGSTLKTYLNKLRRRGYIQSTGEGFSITDEGTWWTRDNCGKDLSQDVDIIEIWRSKFLAGERKILDYVLQARGRVVTREELAEVLGVTASGSTLKTYVNKITRAAVIKKVHGGVTANEDLFLQPTG